MYQEQVAIGECQLDVRRYGSGPPLVVLHGEYGALSSEGFFEALGQHYDVHVPFAPGWEGSTRPSYVRTIRDVALVQQEYLERFGCGVPVVGVSIGGWIASEVAVSNPGLVSALVLVSPLGIKIGGREDRDFVDLYITAPEDRREMFYGPKGAPILEERPGEDVYLRVARSEEALARYAWSPYLHDAGLVHRLRRINAPTLVISGDEDRLVLDPEYFVAFAAAVGSGAEHRTITDAGHRVEEEQTGEVVELIDAFVARSTARDPAG